MNLMRDLWEISKIIDAIFLILRDGTCNVRQNVTKTLATALIAVLMRYWKVARRTKSFLY